MSGGELRAYPALNALPPSAQAILDGPGAAHLFTSRPWYESFVAAGLAQGATPAFFVLQDAAGAARALLPCQRLGAEPGVGGASVASLTSFYSCDFRPLAAAGADVAGTMKDLGRGAARALRGEAVVRFDSLDTSLPELPAFLEGLAVPGRAMLRYEHFGRWWEPVDGLGFDAYLAGRDGALREVVRRRGAKLARARGTFEIVAAADIERGISDYERIYANSWKEPEPFPAFQPVLMRALARAGWLRLALCHLEGRPIAAQIWTVAGGRGTVLKLAHDTEFDRLSPGTLLTAFAIRAIIEGDRVTALDFGRGDDNYKRAWAGRRTSHIGVLWTSLTRRPMMAARHALGGLLRAKTG